MPDARALYDKTHPKDGSLGGTPKDIKVVSSKVLLNSLVGAGMIRPQSQSLGNMSTAEKKTLGNLSAHVQREVEDFQITNGKAPNAKDIQDIVDHQIKSHIAGKGWFGGTKAYFQMGINDVPSVFAKNAATKYGLSDDQVIRFYQASMDKNEAAGKAILQEGK